MSAPYILRRDGHDYQAPDLDTLRAWAQAGRVLPGDMVYSPVYQSWYRASDLRGLRDVLPSPDTGAPPVVAQAVAQCFWLRKGDQNYSAESLEVILQWAADGIIDPDDYIFHPSYGKWFQAGDSPQLVSRFPPHIKHSPPFLPASADPMASAEVRTQLEPTAGFQPAPAPRPATGEPARPAAAPAAETKVDPSRPVESADSMAKTVMDMQAIRVDMLRPAPAKPTAPATPSASPGAPLDGGATGDLGGVTAEQPGASAPQPAIAPAGPAKDAQSSWQHPAGGLFGGQREAVPVNRADDPESSQSGRANGAPGAAIIRKSGAHALVDAAALREHDRARQEAERAREEAERARQAAEHAREEAERTRQAAERVETERLETERKRQAAEQLETERRRAEAERLEAERRRLDAEREAARHSAPIPVSRVAQPIEPDRSGEQVPTGGPGLTTLNGGPRPVTTPVGLPVARPVTPLRPATPAPEPVPDAGGLPRTPTAPMSGESLGRPAPAVPPAPGPFAPSTTPVGMARPGAAPRLAPTTPPTADGPTASARPSEARTTDPAEAPTAPQAAGRRSVTEPIAPGEVPMSPFGERPSTSPGGVPRSTPGPSPTAEQARLGQAPTPVARPTGIASSRPGTSSSGLPVVRPEAADSASGAAKVVPSDTAGVPRPADPAAPRPAGAAKPPPLPAAALGGTRPTPPPLPAALRDATETREGSVAPRPVAPALASVAPRPAAPVEVAPTAPVESAPPTPEPAVAPAASPVVPPSGEPALDPEVRFHDRLGLMKLFYDVAKVFVYTRDLRPGELLESSCTLGQNGEDFLGTAKRGIYHRLTAALEQHIEGPVRAARPEMSADEVPGYELMVFRAQQLLEVMRRAEPLIGQKPPERFIVGNTGRPKMSPEEESLIVEIDTVLKRLISTRAKVAAGRAA